MDSNDGIPAVLSFSSILFPSDSDGNQDEDMITFDSILFPSDSDGND